MKQVHWGVNCPPAALRDAFSLGINILLAFGRELWSLERDRPVRASFRVSFQLAPSLSPSRNLSTTGINRGKPNTHVTGGNKA